MKVRVVWNRRDRRVLVLDAATGRIVLVADHGLSADRYRSAMKLRRLGRHKRGLVTVATVTLPPPGLEVTA